MKIKRKLEDQEEEEKDDEIVHIQGNIYFYAEVTSKNILKLIQCINEANILVFNTQDSISHMKIKLYINYYISWFHQIMMIMVIILQIVMEF